MTYWWWCGAVVVQWLRYCATNRKVAGYRKVAGSITVGVIGIFYWHNPSDRTMALGLNQPLTDMSTRSKECVRLTTLPPSCAAVMKSGNLNLLESSGPLSACNGTAATGDGVTNVHINGTTCSLVIFVLPGSWPHNNFCWRQLHRTVCEAVSKENYLITHESDISATKILLSDNIKC